MQIGKKVIRTQYLLDKKYQLRHIIYVTLIVFVVCSILCYLVYFGSWAWAVNKTLSSINLYPGAHITSITKSFLFQSFISILLISLLFSALWSLFFSHKIAGPAWRFKKTLHAIASGVPAPFVSLRKGDYLNDLAKSFNATLKALEDKNSSQLTLIHEMQGQMERLVGMAQNSTGEDKELQDLAKNLSDNLQELSRATSKKNPV